MYVSYFWFFFKMYKDCYPLGPAFASSHYLFEFSTFILFSIFLTIYNIKYYCKYILINYFQPRKQIKKYTYTALFFGEGTFSEWLKWLTQIFWTHNYLIIYLFIYYIKQNIGKLRYLFNVC